MELAKHLVQCVGVGLAEAVKLGVFHAGFLRNRFQLAQEVIIGFAFAIRKTKSCGWGVPLTHLSLIFQTSFAGIGINLSLADFFLLLPLRRNLRHAFG
jgi:hypothetical protein